MSEAPFRLFADKAQIGALRCLVASQFYSVPVELQKTHSVASLELTGKKLHKLAVSEAFVSEESIRPLLVTRNGPIFTTLAICRYLRDISSLKSEGQQKLLQEAAAVNPDKISSSHVESCGSRKTLNCSPYARLTQPLTSEVTEIPSKPTYVGYGQSIEEDSLHEDRKPLVTGLPSGQNEWLSWIVSDLDFTLTGISLKQITKDLDALEAHLVKRSEEKHFFLCGSSFTLPDMFLWATLNRPHFQGIFKTWPHLCRFLTVIGEMPCVKSVAERYPTFRRKMSVHFNFFRTGAKSLEQQLKQNKFYLTTAINYTNGLPHIGHAYEGVMSDIISRYHRIYNENVFFLTGTDEHGQKIANAAKSKEMQPADMCQFYYERFLDLNKQLHVSQDFFIRTTMDFHKRTCQWLWNRAKAKGDIYLGVYEGWYNEREENFVSELEASLSDYKDPMSGVPYKKMAEESYFFRMSKYHSRLMKHIEENPKFIQPESKKAEILARLSEPLVDLSCSRTSFSWGVQVPDDPKHVMYVWFDALVNYLSAVRSEDGTVQDYWPADVHIIGKDIAWFHTVIWPCMLLSTDIPLPKAIFSHGFVSAEDGRKMSKSLGNVVDPLQILSEFPADTVRFFLAKETSFGSDLKFDYGTLLETHNSLLANTLGNLIHRTTHLCHKYCGGKCPDVCEYSASFLPPFNFALLANEAYVLLSNYDLQGLAELVLSACRDTNKFLTDSAPWTMTDIKEIETIVAVLLNTAYYIAHFVFPFMPTVAEELFSRLDTPKRTLPELSIWYDNIKPGTPIKIGGVLFEKISSSGEGN